MTEQEEKVKKVCTECGKEYYTKGIYASRCDKCYKKYLEKYGMGVNK